MASRQLRTGRRLFDNQIVGSDWCRLVLLKAAANQQQGQEQKRAPRGHEATFYHYAAEPCYATRPTARDRWEKLRYGAHVDAPLLLTENARRCDLILRRLEQIQQRSAVILEIGLASRAQPILNSCSKTGAGAD